MTATLHIVMMHNNDESDHDSVLTSYSVKFAVSVPLAWDENHDCVSRVYGEIVREDCTENGIPLPDCKIGDIKLLRIYGCRAAEMRLSLWQECDAHSQEASDLYQLLFEDRDKFNPSIERMFPDAFNPEVLLIDLVRIDPAHRGRDLGLRAARRAMDLFSPDGGIVVVKPFPVQFNVGGPARDVPEAQLASFTTDRRAAFAALRRYWKRLGFRRLDRTDYYVLCPALISPTIRDLDH